MAQDSLAIAVLRAALSPALKGEAQCVVMALERVTESSVHLLMELVVSWLMFSSWYCIFTIRTSMGVLFCHTVVVRVVVINEKVM